MLYGLHGVLRVFSWNRANQVVKRYVKKVRHLGGRLGKTVTDMQHVESDPLNMIGMNIPSVYGGILQERYWESKEADRFYDRKLVRSCKRIDIKGWTEETSELSSSNEEEEKLVQRYDDDKMELMGAPDAVNFSLFRMSQFGQARSPYAIEFREDLEEGRDVYFAVDGEFLIIRNPVRVEFRVDPHMPRIRLLRFNPESLPSL